MLGERLQRKEDERFIRGSGTYVADVHLPGMVYAAFVRSVHAHAHIRGVNVERARDLPGVIAIITGDEWPELSATLPELNGSTTLTSPYIDAIRTAPHKLFSKKVCYVGEQIAVVIADSPLGAADGADAVTVDYEPLPAVAGPEAALRSDAPRVHSGFDNAVAHLKHEVGDVESAFRNAEIVLDRRLEMQSLKSMAIECRAVAAEWVEATGTLNVWSTCQFHYMLRETLAGIIDQPADRVRVIARDIGGGFGLKGVLHAEDVIIPLIAYRLKRAIRWVETRSEHMMASNHSGHQINDVRIAARRDGIILGLDLKMYKEVGAYDHFDMMLQINTLNHLTTHYKVPNLRAEGWAVATNTPPGSPYRGAGRVEAVFTMDRVLDAVAREARLDPIEVRLKNIVTTADLPYRNGMIYRDGVPIVYDGIDFFRLLNTAKERVEYDLWRRRQLEYRKKGRCIGIGISSYVEGGGIGPCEGATIEIDHNGRVRVKVGVNSQGQSHETTLAQVCAHTIGAAIDDVEVLGGDTNLMRVGFGTGASRVAINSGNAVYNAAIAVRKKVITLAADILGCEPCDISIHDSMISVLGARQNSITLGELAGQAIRHIRMADMGGPGLVATEFFYPKTVTWSSGVNMAVVEVDCETGRIDILKYVSVHDCGLPINPMVVEGQICGGFAQGLGIALGEKVVYDSDGQLLTGSLMDYYVPRANDIPEIDLTHVEFATPDNPLGIKSVGESAPNSPPAAIAAAVEDALDGRVDLNRLPISMAVVALSMGASAGGTTGPTSAVSNHARNIARK
jgi:aerobic carbon-monoxide dehydrogenase large subunit